MAIVTMQLPLCDRCGSITLPKPTLRDGSPNPAFKNPRKQKRCGTCKSPAWNYKEEEKGAHPHLESLERHRNPNERTHSRALRG